MPYQPSVNVKKTDSSRVNDGTLKAKKKELVALCDKWERGVLSSFAPEFGYNGFDEVFKEFANKESNQLFTEYFNFAKSLIALKQTILKNQ